MNDYSQYYLAFSVFKGIGPVTLQRLIKHFGTVKKAWEGEGVNLEKILGKVTAKRLLEFKKIHSIQRFIEELERKNIQFITIEDKQYPSLLKQARVLPPFILYCKGNVSLLNFPQVIAVVGTRKITNYGMQVTEMLTKELVSEGFLIVSGLAFGVDVCAHNTAIKSRGKTIAVLGSGVDYCSPKENLYLYESILEKGGLIISQFIPGFSPTRGSFPARNKVIAGLSLATIVTEGAEDSGSLITANYSFKYGRPVFAVPGPITSGLSKGPNTLLSKGAIAVTSGEDIIKVLRSKYNLVSLLRHSGKLSAESASRIPLENERDSGQARMTNKDEKQIFTLLELGPLHFDEIVRKIGRSTSEIGAILSLMEIKGIVRKEAGVYETCNCGISHKSQNN